MALRAAGSSANPKATSRPASTKPVLSVDSPYSRSAWPTLSQHDENIILDMLCLLLAPIGRQRSATASSSRDGATRGSSRKRKHNAIPAAPQQQRTIATSFTVGLNSTTRYLSELAARSAPASTKSKQPVGDVTGQTEVDLQPGTEPLAAIFLPKSASPILYAHFPLLALAASSAYPSQPLTRLVPLPASAEKKLAAALGIPRAGVIGVKDVEEAKSLLVFVREHVPIVEVPWLAESKDGKWMGTKIVDGR